MAPPPSFSIGATLEFAAQRHAIGSRFGKELREDLAPARILRIGESGGRRRAAFLERRVERDLGILLVEDILPPEFDAPFFVGAANADARVEDRVAVLRLLREQVRTRVIVAGHATIRSEEHT